MEAGRGLKVWVQTGPPVLYLQRVRDEIMKMMPTHNFGTSWQWGIPTQPTSTWRSIT
jgi:hypothetical protein